MRQFAKYIAFLLMASSIGYFTIKIGVGYKKKKDAGARIQNLPDATFKNTLGNPVNLQDFDHSKPIVIIYFHPDCEHCQYEAGEVARNASAFQNSQLIMVSATDSIPEIEKFASDYHLHEIDNIQILVDGHGQFKKVFGKAVLPSVYIYSNDRKLKKRFPGEVKIEAVLMELNN